MQKPAQLSGKDSPAFGSGSSCHGADQLTRRALAFVLAGGRGNRLRQMTDCRAKPGVLFGGRHCIIDFTLANCVNSDVRRIAVLTQHKAQGLIRHLQEHWFLNRRFGEFVDIAPAQQRTGQGWYEGTADAVYQNLDFVNRHRPDFVLVLGGDHVYKMDYAALLADHVASRAEVSVACVDVLNDDAQDPREPARLRTRRGAWPDPQRPPRARACVQPQLRGRARQATVLARCRHARRLLGGEHRAHARRCRLRSLRSPMAHSVCGRFGPPDALSSRRKRGLGGAGGHPDRCRLHHRRGDDPAIGAVFRPAHRPRGPYRGVDTGGDAPGRLGRRPAMTHPLNPKER